MKYIRYTLGTLFAIAAVVLGVYVGLFVMFIGGITDLIDGAKADPTDSKMVAWGVVKMLLGSISGWIVAYFFIALSAFCFTGVSRSKRGKLKKSRI